MRGFAFALWMSTAAALGSSIEDCKIVAGMFDNTCGSLTVPLTSIATHAGA